MVYLDTSVLVALVANEPNAPSVKRWLASADAAALCSSDWCVPEVGRALSMKVRTGQLDEAQADEAWDAFGTACDGLLDLLPVQAADYSTAAQLCRMPQAGLRAGDALHLAVALRSGCDALLAFDQNMNTNARASGLLLITTMTTRNLLVELLVEELPPKALKKLGEAFSAGVAAGLAKAQLIDAKSPQRPAWFATPRRLAVWIPDVLPRAEDQRETKKLVPVSVGLGADNQPTPALQKKLASLGLGPDAALLRQAGRQGRCVVRRHRCAGFDTGRSPAEGIGRHPGQVADSEGDELPAG